MNKNINSKGEFDSFNIEWLEDRVIISMNQYISTIDIKNAIGQLVSNERYDSTNKQVWDYRFTKDVDYTELGFNAIAKLHKWAFHWNLNMSLIIVLNSAIIYNILSEYLDELAHNQIRVVYKSDLTGYVSGC